MFTSLQLIAPCCPTQILRKLRLRKLRSMGSQP